MKREAEGERREVRKARRAIPRKAHSVAFRVTEGEWQKLLRAANQEGTSIPRFTKRAVFQKLGLLVGGKGFN